MSPSKGETDTPNTGDRMSNLALDRLALDSLRDLKEGLPFRELTPNEKQTINRCLFLLDERITRREATASHFDKIRTRDLKNRS